MFRKTLCPPMLASISMTARDVARFSNLSMETAASIAHMAMSNAPLFKKVVRAALKVTCQKLNEVCRYDL